MKRKAREVIVTAQVPPPPPLYQGKRLFRIVGGTVDSPEVSPVAEPEPDECIVERDGDLYASPRCRMCGLHFLTHRMPEPGETEDGRARCASTWRGITHWT